MAPGGIGTYEEFFEILTLKSLRRLNRPIVLYNIEGYYDIIKRATWADRGQGFHG